MASVHYICGCGSQFKVTGVDAIQGETQVKNWVEAHNAWDIQMRQYSMNMNLAIQNLQGMVANYDYDMDLEQYKLWVQGMMEQIAQLITVRV